MYSLCSRVYLFLRLSKMNDFVQAVYDTTGAEWREVRSKTYSLEEIAEYLAECMAEDIRVYFTIREGGELYINTRSEDEPGEVSANGFTVLED